MSEVNVFDDLIDDEPATDEVDELDEDSTDDDDDADESAESDESDEEVLAEVPDGAVSITDFAAMLTFLPDNPYGFVIPQKVYQAVRAKKDPLPHVLVKEDPDEKARVYVLSELALAAWVDRAARSAERGTGPGAPSSKRTREELIEAFTKVDGAVWKTAYAASRMEMWEGIVADRSKTVAKYHRFLKDAGVTADEITELEMSTKKEFAEAEQTKIEERETAKAAKKAEKAGANA